mmetsp:Transcript_6323/g.9736  ORF Transcript_6323/g.9736 Transcript_6323/m.9736 type:complete len:119 (-) Transcript_6323:558-914(-)
MKVLRLSELGAPWRNSSKRARHLLLMKPNTITSIAHLNQTYGDDQFVYCACTSGWIGLTCENKVEVCGNNEHFCLHGSKCISDVGTGDRGYSCDCSQVDDKIGNSRKTRFCWQFVPVY